MKFTDEDTFMKKVLGDALDTADDIIREVQTYDVPFPNDLDKKVINRIREYETRGKGEVMQNYISNYEHLRCQAVKDAFYDFFRECDEYCICDAGKFGFTYGCTDVADNYNSAVFYTSAEKLFRAVLEDWENNWNDVHTARIPEIKDKDIKEGAALLPKELLDEKKTLKNQYELRIKKLWAGIEEKIMYKMLCHADFIMDRNPIADIVYSRKTGFHYLAWNGMSSITPQRITSVTQMIRLLEDIWTRNYVIEHGYLKTEDMDDQRSRDFKNLYRLYHYYLQPYY